MTNPILSTPMQLAGVGVKPMAQEQISPAQSIDDFSKYLGEALDAVNQKQIESERLNLQLAAGQVDDIHQVMIAAQEASLALSLTVQVRNKVIEAYQEMMRMPI